MYMHTSKYVSITLGISTGTVAEFRGSTEPLDTPLQISLGQGEIDELQFD